MAYYDGADLIALIPALTTKGVDAAAVDALVAEFEETAEDWITVAFEPRTITDALIDVIPGSRYLFFPNQYIRTVTALSVDGAAFTGDELTDFLADDMDLTTGIGTRWGWGCKVVGSWTHGLDEPTPALLRACRYFVKAKALDEASDKPRDVNGYTDDSGFSYRVSTPDPLNDRPTGVQEADAILNRLRMRYRVPTIR